ncbi:MAG: hypothetical protein HY064_11165 [Bacteroidetes bacterium]|nr:hypothetical protein [Bacteroidota bacterium]
MKIFRAAILFLLAMLCMHASAYARDPRVKTGLGKGTGIGDGANDNTVKLPIGLPCEITDANENSGGGDAVSSQPSNIVVTFDMPAEIGPEAIHQTRAALDEADDMNAAYVLIRINSVSGTMNSAQDIKNELMEFDRPVLVYVNDQAIPAAKLISTAGDSIYKNRKNNIQPKNKISIPKDIAATHRHYSNEKNENTVAGNFISNSSVNANSSSEEMNAFANVSLQHFKVVEFHEGFSGKLVDWCLDPFVSFFLIAGLSFGLAWQKRSFFPGPSTFFCMVIIPLLFVPLISSGLANWQETVIFSLLLLLITILPMKKRPTRFSLLLLLSVAILFCRTGSMINIDLPLLLINAFPVFVAVFAGWKFFDLLKGRAPLSGTLKKLRLKFSVVR